MHKMKKIYILFVCILFQTKISFSQQSENACDIMAEFSEDFFVNEEKGNDPEAMAEELDFLRENKICINEAETADLLRIPFISEREAYSIARHRQKYGKILSLYELKNIPELDMQTIGQILPFITTESKSGFSLKNSLKYSKNQLFLRYDRTLQDKNGYVNKATAANKKYIGDPNHYFVKYLFQASDKIQFGLVAEKDAGEQVWGEHGKGFDFHSFHFQLSDIDFLKRWVVGDYKVSFGQGLVVGTSSIIGKSSNVMNTSKRNRGLQKYSSTAENGYFRGTGTTIRISNLDFSLFYSQNRIDANLSEEGFITSFKTDGLHRLERELEKKQNVPENISGGNLNYQKRNFSIGGTFIRYRYGNILQPAEKPYNLYKIRKSDNYWNAGIDYTFRTRGMSFFGEFARGKKGGTALLNGVNFHPASRLGISLLYRYYTPDYQAHYANGFSENSDIENEQGFYMGIECNPIKRFKISLYADVYMFPWIKYNLDKPSSGADCLSQIYFYPSQNTTMYLRYKYKTKEKNNTASQSVIFYETHALRYGVQHNISKRLVMHSILDGNSYFDESSRNSYSWLLAQDFSYNFIKKVLDLSFRYAYFHAPTYENRLYIYEKDILHVFSIPAYYGIGHRICLNLRFQPTYNLTCYFKYGTYIYTDGRQTTGSALEEIEGNVTSSVKCLFRYVF